MKPGSVPTARVGPILDELIADRWPHGGGIEVLSEKVDCDWTAIDAITKQDNEGADFDLVDKLFAAVGRPDIWRGELLDLYESMRILEKCRRDGCVVAFVPRMGGPGGFQRYCSRKCRQMGHLKNTGKVADGAKRNLKYACRKGHKRTPENTSAKGACRICDRAQQKAKRATRTPEQIEATRAYNQAYYAARKAAGS